MHDTVLADVAHHFLYDTGRHCKTVARIRTGLRSDGGVDAHQLAAGVNQRTAGVAWIDCRVGLDERLNLHLRVKDIDVTRLGGHDTCRDSRSEVERIADGEHPFADAQFIGVAHQDDRQPCLFDFQERDIGVRVSADQRSRVLAFVVEDHLNLVCTVDDMIVGDNITIFGDDDTRTGSLLRRHLALLSRAPEEKLKEQKEATALAEQRKDELVMYLAHDIRTPLTSVIGYLSLLEEEPNKADQEQAKNIHIALDKAYRLDKMVNEFFEITRYHSKQIKLKKQSVDLYYMLIQLRDEFLPSFSLRNNTVSLDFDENTTIYADPEKIARVFGNILKNAVEYSYPHTKITVSAIQAENHIVITFQNKGKTIPAEKLSSIFDKFYRLDEARISDTGGTGLGLAIAKEIILLHGGTIEAHSENETVTFTVKLPIS